MPNVTIYTTPTCPYCTMAKEFFQDNKIKYTEIDVSKDSEAAKAMVEKSGQMSVPVITVGNNGEENVIVGFQQEELSRALGISSSAKIDIEVGDKL